MLVGQRLLEQALDTVTHLLIRQHHAQAELAEVLEQRVGPSRTLAFLILRIGRRGDGTGIDGRATGGVGYHLTVAEELGDELDIGRLAAT